MLARRLVTVAGSLAVGGGSYYAYKRVVASAQEDDSESLQRDLKVAGPTRKEMLQKLKMPKQYDMLIIGGGATGTGVALVRPREFFYPFFVFESVGLGFVAFLALCGRLFGSLQLYCV